VPLVGFPTPALRTLTGTLISAKTSENMERFRCDKCLGAAYVGGKKKLAKNLNF
jgi:hypothetical protein